MGKRWWIWSGLVVLIASSSALAQEQGQERFRLLVTNETGTMEEALNRAGVAGYRFAATPGGETAFVGNGVVTMELDPEGRRFSYILLATMRAGTLQRELNDVPPEFDIVGMMAFGSLKEAVVILEAEMREASAP